MKNYIQIPFPAFPEGASGIGEQPQQQQWTVNGYTPQFGVYIGPIRTGMAQQGGNALNNGQQQTIGHAFAVNESAIQLVNFTFSGDMPGILFN